MLHSCYTTHNFERIMKISRIRVRNFRLLKDTVLNLKDLLSILVGKNNTGKTSLIVILEKFFDQRSFDLNDFPLSSRDDILNVTAATSDKNLSLHLVMEIQYDTKDDLSILSDLILDIDEKINRVQILFEAKINKIKLLTALNLFPDKEEMDKHIKRDLSPYIETKVYVMEPTPALEVSDKSELVEKDMKLIKSLINLQIIHAKRNVSSSEETKKGTKILSDLTTKFFNSNSGENNAAFLEINKKMSAMDQNLNSVYDSVFNPFLKNAKEFLKLEDLRVTSNLQSKELVSNLSQVVYGEKENVLPEHLNGLGVMNILFLLLQIEIKKEQINKEKKSINLLIIEEPEAHTHPQMQYVFATQIKKIISGINNLQTIITTHSSHIVSQCDFKNVRYLQKAADDNITIKNFYEELENSYTEKDQFRFLVQYLTLQSSELFFADKIIFIEGTTEKILFPYFIRKFDLSQTKEDYIPLSAQHISYMEVGANAKVFGPFLDFLGIKTLIVTDLDSVKKTTTPSKTAKSGETTTYPAWPVIGSTGSSNQTILHFFSAPKDENTFPTWYTDLLSEQLNIAQKNISVAYQTTEDGYHARSFEDAFIHSNRKLIESNLDHLWGLKNKHLLHDIQLSTYDLTEGILDKKSDFAASVLYTGWAQEGDKKVDWSTPRYIKDALLWLSK